jgi:hypothetical protein
VELEREWEHLALEAKRGSERLRPQGGADALRKFVQLSAINVIDCIIFAIINGLMRRQPGLSVRAKRGCREQKLPNRSRYVYAAR